MLSRLLLPATALAAVAAAEVSPWGQCGGQGYSGATDCSTGYYCREQNVWYSQCVPGSGSDDSPTSTQGSPGSSETASTDAQYLITFGDSYSQTGFDVTSTKPSAANPLGNPPLPGWTTSGGRNWIGFAVTEFNASLALSYNFAYGGATVDSDLIAPYDPSVLSMIDQVDQFAGSIASHPAYASWTADNTVVGVWMGVNDVGNGYYLADAENVLTKDVGEYFEQLQRLYDAGARQFVLLSVPPTNRSPLMLGQSDDARALLVKAINLFNDLIASNLVGFVSKNTGVTAKVVDTAVAFNEALDNPQAYGSPDATCFNEDGTSCLWWNNYHPGIAIQELVAAEVAKTWEGGFFS